MDLIKEASSPSAAKNIKKEKINVVKIVQNLIYATKKMVSALAYNRDGYYKTIDVSMVLYLYSNHGFQQFNTC